nr:hypothetical protein [uncultured Microbacterium sp.]
MNILWPRHVEATQQLDRAFDRRRDARLIRDITIRRTDRAEPSRRLLGQLCVDVADDYGCAARNGQFNDRGTNALSRTGDEDPLALKRGHEMSLSGQPRCRQK